MSALPHQVPDDEDRFQRDLVVIGSVARSPLLEAPDPRAIELVLALADGLSAIGQMCNWSGVEVAALIGCGSPEPDRWKLEPYEVLESSRAVIAYLREIVEAVTTPPLERDQQGAARECLYLALEALSRSTYVLSSASFVLRHEFDDGGSVSPVSLVRSDRQGAARELMIRRVNAWFAQSGRTSARVTVTGASMDTPLAWEGSEPDLVGSDYVVGRLATIRTRST